MKNHLQRNLGFLLIGFGALLLAIGLYGLTQPDEFQARTRLAVPLNTHPDINPPINNFRGLRIEQDLATHTTATMKSDSVLSNAIRELNLNSEQNSQPDSNQGVQQAKAIAELRKHLEVRQVPNTRLFEITLTERTPVQAAKYANAIASAYKTEVFRKQQALIQGGIRELKNQHELQQQKTSELETKLLRLREALALPSLEPPMPELETNFPAYHEAKRRLDDEKDILSLIARKIRIEEIDLQSLSNSRQIEIVETAVPPTSPVRRKNLLSAALLLAGLGCCLWGLSVARDAKLFAAPA